MRRLAALRRPALLLFVLVGGLAAFTAWRLLTPTGCMPFTRPGGQPAPPFDEWVARATIPPVVIAFVGAWVALGADRPWWRFIGLLLCVAAAAAGLYIGVVTYQTCA